MWPNIQHIDIHQDFHRYLGQNYSPKPAALRQREWSWSFYETQMAMKGA